MDPPWNPKKVPNLFSKVIFGGPRASPLGPAELQISEKNVKCFEREAFLLGGEGPVQLIFEPVGEPAGQLEGWLAVASRLAFWYDLGMLFTVPLELQNTKNSAPRLPNWSSRTIGTSRMKNS